MSLPWKRRDTDRAERKVCDLNDKRGQERGNADALLGLYLCQPYRKADKGKDGRTVEICEQYKKEYDRIRCRSCRYRQDLSCGSACGKSVQGAEVQRIILTRPAVEAGEKLGFLPGDLQNKVDPYLRPLYDALFDMMGSEAFQRNMERGCIEVAPLAYMRGRTLDDSFIILDEAQNTTPEQMKMFLTRLGFNSKMVITGDVTQIDLPDSRRSGLVEATKILKNIDDIAINRFTEKDVVRHRLVQDIVKAYEQYNERKKS